MAKLLQLGIFFIVQVLSFNSFGQSQPRSVSDLKYQLDQSVNPLSNNRLEDVYIELNTGEGETIFLHTNHKKALSGRNFYVGNLKGHLPSGFRIVIDNDSIEGTIVDRINNRAYRLVANEEGEISLITKDINTVICTEYDTTSQIQPEEAVPAVTSTVYTLQSNPASKSVAYLDFDGELVEGTLWNGGAAINALPGNFTEADIQNIYNLVSEDFAPFNINITTDLDVYNAATVRSRMRCIFTVTKTASPKAGGVAYLNSFTWGDDTPCWVFNSGVKAAGEAASHEIGHTVGLSHDGRTTPKEDYFAGQGNWGPIMGSTYSKSVVQWSIGEYNYANNKQNDINIISTRNGFTVKADDHANVIASATVLATEANGDILASKNTGLISTRTDIDIFKFTTLAGSVNFTVNPASVHPNLDIKLDILDAQGVLIVSSNPTALAASLSYNLNAGTYFLAIDGVGYNLPLSNGYSDYSSLGVYSVSGKLPLASPANILPNVMLTSSGQAFAAPAMMVFTAKATDLDGAVQKVEFFNGTAKLGEDLTAPYEFTWSNVAIGNYNITAKATDNLAGSTTSTVLTIVVKKAPCTVAGPMVVHDAIIGTKGSFNTNGYTREFAFDEDSSTYFDSPTPSNGWVGLELDGIYKITGIRFYPRASYGSRMNGGKFQGSNVADFSSGVVDLATISATPVVDWNCITVSNQASFKYVRYLFPANSNGNVGEIEFHGTRTLNGDPAVSIISPLNKTVVTVPNTLTVNINASDPDGNITRVDLYDDDTIIGTDLTSPYQISVKMDTSKVYQFIAKATDNTGEYTKSDTVLVFARNPVCYVQGNKENPLTILGTTGSYNNNGLTRTKAFDNDTATYFDAPSASNSWVGLDLGSSKTISGIRFFARANYTNRMLKGRFQVATNASFTTGLVNIDTITKVYNNEWNCVEFTKPLNYRYIRYLSPSNGYANIAEMQVFTKSSVTGLEQDLMEVDGFILYPNPAKDKITIRSLKELYKVSVSNAAGSEVMEFNSKDIEIINLNKGVYAVSIQFKDGERRTEKLVIAR